MEEEEAKNITLHPVVNGNSAHGNNSTGDNVKTENRSSTGTEEVGMFDDPKYFFGKWLCMCVCFVFFFAM